MGRKSKYSKEFIEYIKEISEGTPRVEIIEKVKTKYNINLTENQLTYLMNRNGIKTGVKIKGLGEYPIGAEREETGNRILVKTVEPNIWEYKHLIEWRKYYGEIPKGHVVSARNRNLKDTRIENLILLTKQQAGYLSRKTFKDIEYINDDAIRLIDFMIEIKKAKERMRKETS